MGVAILTLDKMDFKTKAIKKDKYITILIKESMQKGDITLINTYACNILIGAPKYWVGSITSYGRIQMSFLANPIHKTNTNRH